MASTPLVATHDRDDADMFDGNTFNNEPREGSHILPETEPSLSGVSNSEFSEENTETPNWNTVQAFNESYETIRRLGHGGMGTVFLARDRRLGRLVAIKLLHDRRRAPARLLAEAQATARARHENIVIIYDVGLIDGHPYMVLEYLAGQTLRDALSKSRNGTSRSIPCGMAVDIMTAVLRALSAAHDNGIIHCDLKPENIMLLDSGQVKVLDFGLARSVDTANGTAFRGTRAYMAPEQWLGQVVDERADIWAAGMILFELLAGGMHPLASSDDDDAIWTSKIVDMDTPIPKLGQVRSDMPGLAEIVDRCLRKRKEERFPSVAALLVALEAVRSGGGVFALGDNQSPFAGLSAFQESDAGLFFGRERDVALGMDWLRRHALVTVAGASGSGKSSFLRAGMVPALKRSGETWDIMVIRPGRSPLAALSDAAQDTVGVSNGGNEPGGFASQLRARCNAEQGLRRILIFVDQFEELFTLGATMEERRAFLSCLLAVADDESSPLRVILAIRADFLEHLAEDAVFWGRARAGLFFLPPMGRDGLQSALVRPLERIGYRFELDSMIDEIVDDLGSSKGPLPLLQFAGLTLWESRDSDKRILTRASYEALGGVAGALSTHADAVVARLSEQEQRLCRAILLRLVTPERTRAIVKLDELEGLGQTPGAVLAVVHTLSAARLLLLEPGVDSTRTHVELVHESLIEKWPMLARWLDEHAGDAYFLARLHTAASQWQAAGEPTGLLWRERAAEEARAWYARFDATRDDQQDLLGVLEERYLKALISLTQRSRRRWRNGMIGAFVFISTVAVVVFFLAVRAREQARRADEEAARVRERNEALAFEALKGRNATRLLAARKVHDDPTTVLAILREVEAPDIPKDWSDLVSASLTSGIANVERRWREQPVYRGAFSPDGTRIGLAMNDGTVHIVRADDLEDVQTLRGHLKYLWTVAWSADGKRIVSASGDKTARVWNVDGKGEPIVLRGHTASLNSAFMSPDGTLVVTASDDKTARVYDSSDGREITVLRHDAEVSIAQFSPDGKHIVTAADRLARVWNVNGTGAPLVLRGHQDVVVAAAFDPHSARIATASKDNTVRVWGVSSGNPMVVLRGHEDKVMSVAWSPDGKRIASASKDKTARIWNDDGHGDPIVLRGHQHWVYSAVFSPDNRRLVTTSLDKTVRLWNLDDIIAPAVLRGHDDIVSYMSLSPSGKRVVTASSDLTVRVWNTDGTGPVRVFRGHEQLIDDIAWSRDDAHVVSMSKDGTGRIWSVDPAADPIVFPTHRGGYVRGAWSRDGKRIALIHFDCTIQLFGSDGHPFAETRQSCDPSAGDIGASFDPTSQRLLTFDDKHPDAQVWQGDGLDNIAHLGPHETAIAGAEWSPDGKRILTGTSGGVVRIWDAYGRSAPVVIQGAAPFLMARWSPDGQRIATIGADGRIYIQDGNDGHEYLSFGHSGESLRALAWSADGRRVIVASAYAVARVWNVDGSGIPFVLGGPLVGMNTVAVNLDGSRIAIQAEEPATRLWPDVHPFSGLDDVRLWTATSYCLTPDRRMELLGIADTDAKEQMEKCRRRVNDARHAMRSR